MNFLESAMIVNNKKQINLAPSSLKKDVLQGQTQAQHLIKKKYVLKPTCREAKIYSSFKIHGIMI